MTNKQISISLSENNEEQLNWLIDNTYMTNKSEVGRFAINMAYQDFKSKEE